MRYNGDIGRFYKESLMSENLAPNYPDILGYVTGGQRLAIDHIVEIAAAVHPAAVRVGRPFDVIAVMQNITDVNLQVTAVLQLPLKDAKKAENRFIFKNDRLSITLHPAETGYLILPVSTEMDTAPGNYTVGIALEVKSMDKPQRIRQKTDSAVNLNYYFSLSEDSIEQLATLKGLTFSSTKHGRFSKAVEAPFRLGRPKTARPLRNNPEWISLWSLGMDTDVRPLLERHYRTLIEKVLPKMQVIHLYKPLFNSTRDRIHIAGYPIRETEIHYITKLLVSVLQMSIQSYGSETYPGEDLFRIVGLIKAGWPKDGRPIPLPNWCRRLLYTIGFDNRVIENPVEALSRPLYEELIRDAVWHGFKLLHQDSNVNLGSDEDIRAYGDQIVRSLWEPELSLDFLDVHMPLVLGGLLVDDRVKMASEDRLNNFHFLMTMYENLQDKYEDDMGIVFELGLDLIDRLLQKHGFWQG
jgi:hypothetical protein